MPFDVDDLADGYDTDMMRMDGYDDCVLGVVHRFGQEPVLCYDVDKVIAKLMADGMDYDGAQEWLQFNMLGAWLGEGTPAFLTRE